MSYSMLRALKTRPMRVTFTIDVNNTEDDETHARKNKISSNTIYSFKIVIVNESSPYIFIIRDFFY